MKDYLPFVHALEHARSLKLKTMKEWRVWCKSGDRLPNTPSRPDYVYKHEGWQGYGHWLGTDNVAHKDQEFLPFTKSLTYARSLKMKNTAEWRAWCKTSARPANIPSTPDAVYKHDGWQGYGHWFGTGNVAPKDKQFLPFKKALLHARSLKMKGKNEWKAWCKTGARPANIPSNPQRTYKHEGWQGYGHWLGTGNVGVKKDRRADCVNPATDEAAANRNVEDPKAAIMPEDADDGEAVQDDGDSDWEDVTDDEMNKWYAAKEAKEKAEAEVKEAKEKTEPDAKEAEGSANAAAATAVDEQNGRV